MRAKNEREPKGGRTNGVWANWLGMVVRVVRMVVRHAFQCVQKNNLVPDPIGWFKNYSQIKIIFKFSIIFI